MTATLPEASRRIEVFRTLPLEDIAIRSGGDGRRRALGERRAGIGDQRDPLAVAEPFGLGEAKSYDLVKVARDHGASLHLAGVERIDGAAHAGAIESGSTIAVVGTDRKSVV
mgnify:CR=1 FL=1